MRLKSFVFAVLFLTGMLFTVVPANAQTGPVSLTIELRSYVESLPDELFKGFGFTITEQVRSALISKIDIVIKLFEKGNYQGGYMQLNNDIAPKLGYCETKRVRALSWFSNDVLPEDEVYRYAGECQDLIEDIRLADPRPTP